MATKGNDLVQFSFFKEAFVKETAKAICIITGDRRNPNTVWLPKSSVKVEDDPEREGYNLVTLPAWLYFSKPELVAFTDYFTV